MTVTTISVVVPAFNEAQNIPQLVERVAQVLNITFEGYRNACIPAAARLAGDLQSLRALATRTLAGSSTLTVVALTDAVASIPTSKPRSSTASRLRRPSIRPRRGRR